MTPFSCHSVIQSDLDKHLMLDIKLLRNNYFLDSGQILFTAAWATSGTNHNGRLDIGLGWSPPPAGTGRTRHRIKTLSETSEA